MSVGTFEGKRVWITGASSGIGEALAHEFARRGASLVLSARREKELERVASALGENRRVAIVPLDLGSPPDSLADAARKVWESIGPVEVMVHNAGVSQRSRAIETSLAVDERIMRINYFGTVALTKALLPRMLEARSGHFVVVSSLVGVIGSPMRSAYAASKHALHGFFDSLRAEIAGDGLGVTLVCPGFVRTDVSRHALTGDGSTHGVMDTATERGLAPDVFARRMVDAVGARKTEVYIGGREVVAVYAKRFAPGVFARVLPRARVM